MQERSRGLLHKVIWYLFIWTVSLWIVISASSTISAIRSCNRGRFFVNSTWGLISSGAENYREDSYCVWHIQGNPGQYVTLKFHKLQTECSYDHVFVYDGSTNSSRMLGSFSGRTVPTPVTSTTGSMVVLLFSDSNYVLEGFEGEYSITDCPLNCSSHGHCNNNACECHPGYTGTMCEHDACPEDCGTSEKRGSCQNLDGVLKCVCNEGFYGLSCSLHQTGSRGNSWHLLSHGSSDLSRTASGVAYISSLRRLFIFGGYNLNTATGDLLSFNFSTSVWTNHSHVEAKKLLEDPLDNSVSTEIVESPDGLDLHESELTTEAASSLDINELSSRQKRENREPVSGPSARFSHAMAEIGLGFILFGGQLSNKSLSNELWYYSAVGGTWKLLATQSKFQVPPLARHTLTVVNDSAVYIFGGNTNHGQFSSTIYCINIDFRDLGSEQWRVVRPRGGKTHNLRLVGHTTVYHEESRSLVVYGGIAAEAARHSKLSDRIFLFDLEELHWTEILYPRGMLPDLHIPLERAFHSASIMGQYMVIFGGYTHKHNREEVCYDAGLYFYHLGCHMWVSHHVLDHSPASASVPGVYSHATATMDGNVLLVFGGYRGSVSSNLWAYMMPSEMVRAHGERFDPEFMCVVHRTQLSCTANPECGWCPTDGICYGRAFGTNCTSNLQTTQCPGICPALPDCLSCTIHGQVSKPKHASKAGMGQCAWCVQTARCHRRNDNLGVCGAGMETPSGIVGWWGSEGTDITDVEECRTRDFRPGLTFLTYEHPANYSQPDELTIINSTLANIPLAGKYPHLQDRAPGNAVVARMLGFIHPLASKTKPVTDYQQEMKVMMDASYASAVLKISLDDRAENLETVATLTANDTNTSRVEAMRPNKTPIFPDPTRGNRYLMDFVTFHTFGTGAEGINDFQREISRMQLVWNSKTNYKKIFTFEYVEPFSNGSCSTYSNCLHCLSDSLCGWCESNQRCLPRIVTNNATVDDLSQCYVDTNSTGFLVLTPSQCTNCSNHISCDSCVGSGLCEWMVEDSQCVRRGRFPNAVVAVEQCPIPCHKRDGCAACLGEPGRCTWCEETQTCFAFSAYTSMFQYGMCREWVDVEPPPVETISRLHALRGDLGGSMSVPSTSSLGKVAFPPYTSVGNTGRCKSCESKQSCGSCLVELGCGWCYYSHNPLIGICTKGDFTAPSIGECSALLGDVPPGAETTQWRWSYAECPDVDECSLGHHDCHPDAACLNTPGSYVCACKKGFIGDGKTFCERTCFEECVHGHCTGPPDYQCACELGWTGSDCSQDCQCHGHSTCYQGVGKCDQCQDWTDGPNCELCRPGSYGNATTSEGCQICQCNDHGNATAGICNPLTGQCYCQDETEGSKCERCKPGYYGDARQGGICYRQCSSRSILTSVTSGNLGSYTAPDTHEGYYSKSDTQDCIWVLGLHDSIVGPYSESSLRSGIIRLTIQQAANVSCSVNHVYVYDGLPEFMGIENGWNRQNQLLGTFCSPRSPFPVTVDAHSGIMTVFYRKSDMKQGFNATYTVIACPSACPHNRTCIAGKCVCPSGWVGVKCEIPVCPNDCFSQLGHGKCEINYGRCICNRDYAGLDCGQVRRASALVVTELTVPEKLSDNLEHLRTVLPRLGHSLIADHRGSLWLFGGYSMSRGPVDDIREFDTKNSTWLQVNVHVQPRGESSLPPGRYFHAAEYVTSQRGIYVYGGIGSQDFLSDFWKFDINSRRWFEIDTRDSVPPLAGHTLTLRNDGEHQTLILVGGFSPEYGFLEKVFEFSPDSGTWNVLNTTGTPPVGIYGHSAAYHISTKSLYVYGGMLYEVNKVFVSSNLYALHFPTRRWSLLTVDRESNPAEMLVPRPRYLHTAVTTEDYMLIIGGLTEPYNGSDTIMAYSFACNLWIPLSHKSVELIGSPLPPMVASAASRQVSSNAIYLMGGMWAGTAKGTLLKLEVPEDLCVLWSHSKLRCKATPGCSYCGVYEPSGSNATFCYSSSKPQPERCNQPQGVSEFSKAVGCGPERVASRDCYHHKSCSECLGEWPIYRGVPQACQWCTNCQFGRCIPKGADCDEEHRCVIKQRETVDAAQCHERSCPASDCDKCRDLGRCIWTRQVVRTSELSRQLLNSPITEWNCVSRNVKDSSSFLVISMPPHACPPRCYQHQGCRECLESTGSEGGWHECRWSTALGQCIAPSYQALQCIGGMCGAILQGSSATCPRPCSQFTQCSTCHQQPHCGWCSLDSAPVSGIGLCVNGNLEGPFLDASCAALDYSRVVDRLSLNISHTRKPSSSSKLHHTSNLVEKMTSWHYQGCPLENECLNGHHTCDAKSERCVDRENGYACICSEGYVSHGSVCRPVCSQGCVHGDCVEPNVCRCHFGFVGINCSIQCKCNGHSECAGPDQLDVCLDCRNNTVGPQCSKCKPLFVGDPRNNGQCISCYEYCNGHTHICHGHDLVLTNLSLILLQSPWSPAALNAWTELIQEGPKTQAVCHACANLTMGEKCEECIPGNFRGSEDRRKPCRPCECHGHGDMCHPVTGEGCNCHNNTESDPQCRPGMAPIGRPMNGPNGFTPPPVPCWSLQCDKCKEYYLGTPTQGHQCYRQMTVDTEFCLDPETQEECNRKPTPLHPRRPVFFAIQPKFMNVDIRLVVDIALGGVDIYFAPKDDMFIVKYDSSINGHRVDLDPKYVFSVDFGQGGQVNLQHPTTSVPVERLVNTSDRFIAHPPYGIWERKAVGLTTFLTVDDPNSVVIVRGLKNRLVLTLPKDRHDLRTTRFYILVQGAGNVSSEVTFGSLFFRQDQPRIDLFVFFSVFFSCFFLFLAVSVVAWKAKHVIEGRRARERQAVEMMHMARRPFASVLVIVDTQNGNDNTAGTGKGPTRPLQNVQQLVSPRRWKLRTGHPHSVIADPVADALRNASDVRPIAVEPTADNFAAIVTLLVQLPGGRRTRNQLSLASSLVLPPRSRSSHATTES